MPSRPVLRSVSHLSRSVHQIHLLVSLSLAGLLVYAGVIKALEPWTFFGNLRQFGFGVYPSAVLAVLLPVAEVTIGGLLLTARLRLPALLLAVLLGLAFVAVQVPVLLSGRSVTCACLGSSQPVSWWTLARALVFLGAAAWACGYSLLAARSQVPPHPLAPLGVQPRPQQI